jgi:hypothetical protein
MSSTYDGDSAEEQRADTSAVSWYPPGTFPADKSRTHEPPIGRVMTCSDKIAVWNAVGIQGALLSHILASPLYVDSITVGRKFSEPHARRALCCRLQDFSYDKYPLDLMLRDEVRRSERGSEEVCESEEEEEFDTATPYLYCTHHPVLMQTSVKFDEGAIVTASASAIAHTPATEGPEENGFGVSSVSGVMRSDDGGGVMRSDDGGGVIRSDDGGGVIRSDDGGGIMRSDDGGGVMRSDDGGGGVMRSDDGGVMRSDDGGGVMRSDDGGGVMRSDDGGGVMRSDDSGGAGGQASVSVVGACFSEKRCIYWSASINSSYTPDDGGGGGGGGGGGDGDGGGGDKDACEGEEGVVLDGETGLLWRPTDSASDGEDGSLFNETAAAEICSAKLLARYEWCTSHLRSLTQSGGPGDGEDEDRSTRPVGARTAVRAQHTPSVSLYRHRKRYGCQHAHINAAADEEGKNTDAEKTDACNFSLAKDKLLNGGATKNKKNLFGDWIRTTSSATT